MGNEMIYYKKLTLIYINYLISKFNSFIIFQFLKDLFAPIELFLTSFIYELRFNFIVFPKIFFFLLSRITIIDNKTLTEDITTNVTLVNS